jgi:hypothetical protein
MIDTVAVIVVAYAAIGAFVVAVAGDWQDRKTGPQADWVMIALGWPVFVVVVALMLLLGVVLPLWDEIDFWSLLRRS